MNTTLRRLFTCAAAGALAVSLVACGPDDGSAASSQLLSAGSGLEPGWSMMDLAGVDPAFVGDESAALPQALPMAASYGGGGYAYAPSYDYAPDRSDRDYVPLDDSAYYDDGYYDDGYYEDGYYDGGYYDARSYDDGYDEGSYNLGNDSGDYGLLALAVSLAAMLGDSPPDYGYSYDGVSPWAWQTGDGYYRYAEPIDDGYRYYYYEPGGHRPFLVSDPYYSYGYRDDRLVAIYDRGGRRVDARRAELQLRAAKAYYARADRLYEAAQRDRYGVPAPLWARQRGTIAAERDRWYREQAERPAWQRWETRNQPKLYRQWSNEALVRRDAERNFDGWQRADYKTPPPAFYTPSVRQQQVTRIAELRRDRAAEVTERRRERDEQRAAQQREMQALAQRAQDARRERTRELAERRERAPDRREPDRRERGIAISEIRERAQTPSLPARIAERREQRRAERPSVAQRIERERPTAAARLEARRAEVANARAERAAPQPRAQQPKREQPQAAVKRARPAERVRAERPQPQARTEARREAPAPRAERQAREVRQSAPERASRPEPARQQTRAAPQPRADRAERQQAMQQRSDARQQARQERVAARQQAAPQPGAERPRPRQQARQEAAPQPRQERAQRAEARPHARAEPAQRQQQADARQQAREERQEARAAKREERRQRPT